MNVQEILRKASRRLIFLHVLGCLIFIAIPVLGERRGPGNHYYAEILEYGFTIFFFYLNYYFLLPHFFFRKRYVAFVLWALSGFAVVSVLPEIIVGDVFLTRGDLLNTRGTSVYHLPPPHHPHGLFPALSNTVFGPLDENFLKYSVMFVMAMTLRFSVQIRSVQKQMADAEIGFLKAQINPHFLFNTLNSIYTLTVEAGADDAAKAIVQLSALMRYAAGDANAEMVPLDKELKYIDNYVTLQRMRLNERVHVFYAVNADGASGNIAPFLLIPFIENAFKYGVSTEEASDLRISISVQGKSLHMLVRNRKVHAQIAESGTSVGIANTRRRLELLYPGAHHLDIRDEAAFFEVKLALDI
ncbi:sensor histidine kinase [Rurimicrobium arvi]|uniref:Histidine kinase n=1 Tax=Rurimicrobium arvi TaxID=2049916 RepID=A0ABP8MZ24_9BACT